MLAKDVVGQSAKQAAQGIINRVAPRTSSLSRLLRGGRIIRWKGRTASCAPRVVDFFCIPYQRMLALAIPALFAAGPTAAAEVYWDPNNTAVGIGGSGTWNTTTPSWSLSADGVSGPYETWNNALPDDVHFRGTAGTVTIGEPIVGHNISFETTGYILAGTGVNTLTLAGPTPTIAVSVANSTISARIAGTNGFVKTGTGALNLTGSNTFTGTVDIQAGILAVNSNAALGNAGNVVNLGNGATFISNASLAGRAVNLSGPQVRLQGSGVGNAHFTGSGGALIWAGVSMTDDTNDYTGQTGFFVDGGASFTSVRDLGQPSSLGAGTGPNGTIVFTSAIQYADAVYYVGTGDSSNRDWLVNFFTVGSTPSVASLGNNGSGKLTLTGGFSIQGTSVPFSFNAGTADLDVLGVISSSSARTIGFVGNDSARTITLGDANTFPGPALLARATVKVGTLADAGSNSSLGAGTDISVLDGAVLSYTGGAVATNRPWIIRNGTLRSDGSGALTLTGPVSYEDITTSNALTLGGSYAATPNTIAGVISGNGNLVSAGNATWTLSGNNTRTGGITVQGGTLRAGSATAFGTITGLTVNGGMLDLNGYSITAASLAGSGGSVALGSGRLTVNAASGANSSYAGGINGTGGLTKMGAGTLTLTGVNTYSGDTILGGGTLALDFSAPGAPASNILSGTSILRMSGATLKLNGGAVANSQDFSGLNIIGGSNVVSATSGPMGLAVNLGSISYGGGLVNFGLPASGYIGTTNPDGVLGGWATVNSTDYAKVAGGKIVAFAASDYTQQDNAGLWGGGQIISDAGGGPNTPYFGTVNSSVQLGGLQYTANNNSTVTIAPGQTLGLDGTIIVAPSVGTPLLNTTQQISGGNVTGPLGGGTLGVLQNATTNNFVVGATIVDNGGSIGFSKSGPGLATLSGLNTYTGPTTVSGGTLSVNTILNGGQASAIGASDNASSNLVLEGSTLRYTGAATASDRGFTVVTNGAVTSGTIDVSQAPTNLTFSGQVTSADGAGLTKTGAGTLTLSNAANNYGGPTTISGGVLAASTLANGGVSSSIGASSNAASNLVLQNGGVLQYLGSTVASDRSFTLNNGGGIGVGNAATTLTMSGTAVGSGPLVKTGPGTLVLSGTNTYTGASTVNAGTLRAGSTQAFGGGLMTVASGATLDLANFSNTAAGLNGAGNVLLGSATLTTNGNGSFSGIISGPGGLFVADGTQTMGGCRNTYSGGTSISSAALATDCLANGGQPSGIGASTNASANLAIANGGSLSYTGPTVNIDRGFNLAGGEGYISIAAATTLGFSGQAVGPGRLRKTGAGELVLSNTNTYSGGTVVDGGVLRAGAPNAFGTAYVAMQNVAGATLDLAGFNTTLTHLRGGGSTGGNVALGTAQLTISDGGNQTFLGAISGSGGIVKSGGPAVFQGLGGCNNSYTGSTTIRSGVLQVDCLKDGGTTSSIGASTIAPTNLALNGGALQYTGAGDSTNRQFTLGASGAFDASGSGALMFTSTAPISFSGSSARTLTLSGTNTAYNTLAAQIGDGPGGATSLTKMGPGTWVLTNPASTYTGRTTISGGVLAVDELRDAGMLSSIGASANLASNLVIGQGSTLRYTGTGDATNRLFSLDTGVTFIESSGTGALMFTNTSPVTLLGPANSGRTIALGGTNTGPNTLGGTIGNNGTGQTVLAKNGPGTWFLTGNNTYTGNTVVNDGLLVVGNGATTGNAGSGNVIVAASTSTLAIDRSDAFDFNGTLSGPGALAQIGTGTTRLTATGSSIGASYVRMGTLQVDGSLATPTVVMNFSSRLAVNGTVETAAAAPVAITGGDENSTITVGATGVLRANGDLAGGSDTVTVSGTLDTGAAKLGLGAGDDILVLNDSAVFSGAGVDAGAGVDTLQVNTAVSRTLDAAQVSSFEALNKSLGGTLVLTGNHSYTSGTTIGAGTLQVGDGATPSGLSGNVANSGTLAFNVPGSYTFSGVISGSGVVNKLGAGTTTLASANGYAGATNVMGGTLLVNGDQSLATGDTTVSSGATLGGSGTIGGRVTVADGATLSPGGAAAQAGTLTIKGDLALAPTAVLAVDFGQPNVVGGPLNDLISVAGNVSLAGTLNVTQTPGGSFGPGLYRVISYGGTLTDNGMAISPSTGLALQTSVAQQVNLVNAAGVTLNFWDGDAGPKYNGVVNGGNGTWRAAGDNNWTDANGVVNATFSDGSMAVFAASPGTVAVEDNNGAIHVSGMQFASNGYVISGDAVGLTGSQAAIRVGDGSAAGAGYTAVIASSLSGASQLVKTDLGELVLSGTNTYTGGTLIDAGTLSISADSNLGASAAGVALDGATLQTTANLSTGRAITLSGVGTILTYGATSAVFTGDIVGAGTLRKDGAGTLIVAGDALHTGGTTIAAGTLQVGNGAATGTLSGDVLDNGTLAFNRSDTHIFGGTVSGSGSLVQAGTGTTILSANHSYTGGTTIQAGTLQLGAGGASGAIGGDVTNNGMLAFNRSDTATFNGKISGSGALRQDGTGVTILTAANTYGGTTDVNAGTLLVQGDQSLATGATVVSAGTLGGSGIAGGSVTVADNATVAPGGATAAPGTLGIKGNLSLAPNARLAYDFGQANVVGGAYNDLLEVGGNVTLDGTLDVSESAGGSFGPGLYRVISYGGALVDNGLSVSSPDYSVQTSVARQVNLVHAAGMTTRSWEGTTGGRNDGNIDGGDGVWQGSLGNDNWTNDAATLNAPFQAGSFAIFAGTSGTVSVDNSQGDVRVSGMQFATSGYRVQDGQIELAGPRAILRVGDGTLAGQGYTATIASVLTGDSELVKTDLGKLVLAGINRYTGGTRIEQGTVSIQSDANLGAPGASLTLAGGTLETTGNLDTPRPVILAGNGTVLTDVATTAVFTGDIAGAGALTKDGGGTLVIAGDAAHTGGTTIAAGELQVGNGGAAGTLAGDVLNNGTLAFNRTDTTAFAGTISGTGAVRQLGSGTTILTGMNSYGGGTTIVAGTLQLGDGGTSGMITGDVTNHGTLAFNRSDTVAFNGTISATGSVRQDGAGMTVLTAANLYTGTTTVNGGTLLVLGDQTLATGATTVNAGTLGGTGVIGGDVSVASGAALAPGASDGEPGTLTVKGNVVLVAGAILDYDFGQPNTVGGALNDLLKVNGDLTLGGTLNVTQSPGGTFGPGLYRIISYEGNLIGGTLDVGAMPDGARPTVQTSIGHQVNLVSAMDNNVLFWDGDAGGRNDGTITGGNGTWRATGDDNWTNASGGTSGPYTNGSFAVFAGTPGTVTVDVSKGDVAASGMQFATSGYSVQGDRIILTGGQAVIRVGDGTADGANYVASIDAPLSGAAGLTKTDLGTLVLSGTSDYTGPTNVAGGTLNVTGSIASSAVTVQSGAILAGGGTVGNTTVASGATVAPGNSIGTLTFNGAYVQQPGAVYQAELDPGSNGSDRIAVNGTATLADGAVINVTKTTSAPYAPGTRYTVLTTTSGLQGTFKLTGDTAVSAFLRLTDTYDPDNAYLTVQQSRSIETAGQTRNEIAAAGGLDSLPSTNPLKIAVLNLQSDAETSGALKQLTGEIHASIRTAAIEDSRFVRDAVVERLRETFCGVGSEGGRRAAARQYGAPESEARCAGESKGPAGWVRVFGSWQHTSGDGNAAAMDDSTSGIFVGTDMSVGQGWRAGVLTGYSHSDIDVDGRNSSASSDNYHLGAYGGGQWGALGMRTGAAYTWQDISTGRSVNFAGVSDTPRANYSGKTAQVFGDVGYRIDAGKVSYEPFVNVAYVSFDTGRFKERGGPATLTSPGDRSDVIFSTAGLRAAAEVTLGGVDGVARGSLGWRHAAGDDKPVATMAYPGGERFGVAGVAVARDAAVVNAGLDLRVGRNTVFGVSYDGQFGGGSTAQSVRANLTVRF